MPITALIVFLLMAIVIAGIFAAILMPPTKLAEKFGGGKKKDK
ncbi:MAG: hypothetical protein SFV18_13080 [Bryobacteraceae bacterium]|nr:hypothetical protein [Bryobacteraceae bacterium]